MPRTARTKQNQASERLIDALWVLLEERPFRKITVGAVTDLAQCNRATFYYHFEDMEDLLRRALERELMAGEGMPAELGRLLADAADDQPARPAAYRPRMLLVIRRAGRETFGAIMGAIVTDMWRTLLCPEGVDLTPQSKQVIEFAVSGATGLLSRLVHGQEEPDTTFIRAAGHLVCEGLGQAQGMPASEVASRLQLLGRMGVFGK